MSMHCTHCWYCVFHRGPSFLKILMPQEVGYIKVRRTPSFVLQEPLQSHKSYFKESGVELEMIMGTGRVGSPPAEIWGSPCRKRSVFIPCPSHAQRLSHTLPRASSSVLGFSTTGSYIP